MKSKHTLLRDGEKEVVIVTTPSGVTAVVATSITDEALLKFERSLRRKIRARERSQQRGGSGPAAGHRGPT